MGESCPNQSGYMIPLSAGRRVAARGLSPAAPRLSHPNLSAALGLVCVVLCPPHCGSSQALSRLAQSY